MRRLAIAAAAIGLAGCASTPEPLIEGLPLSQYCKRFGLADTPAYAEALGREPMPVVCQPKPWTGNGGGWQRVVVVNPDGGYRVRSVPRGNVAGGTFGTDAGSGTQRVIVVNSDGGYRVHTVPRGRVVVGSSE